MLIRYPLVAFSETKWLNKESLLLSYVEVQARRQEFICLALMTFKMPSLVHLKLPCVHPVSRKGKEESKSF